MRALAGWRRPSPGNKVSEIPEAIGCRFAFWGCAREAGEVLEEACIRRFGGRIPGSHLLMLRSGNWLVLMAKHFRQTTKRYEIDQEFIRPYTPEQNGLVEHFLRP